MATGTKSNPLEDWRDLKHLCLLNLTYDFTPANLVSCDFVSKLWKIFSYGLSSFLKPNLHSFWFLSCYDETIQCLQVDAIISEISVIPCTSVPVVLRLKKDDINWACGYILCYYLFVFFNLTCFLFNPRKKLIKLDRKKELWTYLCKMMLEYSFYLFSHWT